MKKLSKLFAIILALCFIVSALSIQAFASTPNYELNTSSDVSTRYLMNISNSNQAFSNLFTAFYESEDNYTTSNNDYTVSGIHATGFPDYYAGAYINTDGELVVLLTSGLTSVEKDVAKITVCKLAQTDNIVFGEAEHSYSELVSTMSDVLEYTSSSAVSTYSSASINSGMCVTEFRLDDYKNQVIVGVDPSIMSVASLEDIDDINSNSVLCSDLITLEESSSSRVTLDTVNFNCGSGLSGNGFAFSSGFRAKYVDSNGSTVYGLITCGHAFTDVTTAVSVMHGNSTIGTLDPTRNQRVGKIDAAFIKLNSSSSINNKVVTSDGSTYVISTSLILGPALGSVVYMYGQTSDKEYGYIRSGTLDSISASTVVTVEETHNYYNMTDQYKTSYTSLGGDSGGIVFSQSSSGVYAACGVHVGSSSDAAYCSKATNIASIFGISVY